MCIRIEKKREGDWGWWIWGGGGGYRDGRKTGRKSEGEREKEHVHFALWHFGDGTLLFIHTYIHKYIHTFIYIFLYIYIYILIYMYLCVFHFISLFDFVSVFLSLSFYLSLSSLPFSTLPLSIFSSLSLCTNRTVTSCQYC